MLCSCGTINCYVPVRTCDIEMHVLANWTTLYFLLELPVVVVELLLFAPSLYCVFHVSLLIIRGAGTVLVSLMSTCDVALDGIAPLSNTTN